MPRLARIVVPGVPHHVTQRGNRKEQTFFNDEDYALYRSLLGEAAKKAGAEVWAYVLMPNHVHAIVVPPDEDGLRRTFADAHRRYTNHINRRNGWTGHLWQGRFGSVAMDGGQVLKAVKYISLNPVRAKLVKKPEDWKWSSVGAHLAGKDDELVRVKPLLDQVPDFANFVHEPVEDALFADLRRSEKTGRPVGSGEWMAAMERQVGRPIVLRKRGPKPKQ